MVHSITPLAAYVCSDLAGKHSRRMHVLTRMVCAAAAQVIETSTGSDSGDSVARCVISVSSAALEASSGSVIAEAGMPHPLKGSVHCVCPLSNLVHFPIRNDHSWRMATERLQVSKRAKVHYLLTP